MKNPGKLNFSNFVRNACHLQFIVDKAEWRTDPNLFIVDKENLPRAKTCLRETIIRSFYNHEGETC